MDNTTQGYDPKPIPDSVQGEGARHLYAMINQTRADLKVAAAKVKLMADRLKSGADSLAPGVDRGEAIANVMLTYRHLEDASMRLGKALQALDGGVSVYDRATTVGA